MCEREHIPVVLWLKRELKQLSSFVIARLPLPCTDCREGRLNQNRMATIYMDGFHFTVRTYHSFQPHGSGQTHLPRKERILRNNLSDHLTCSRTLLALRQGRCLTQTQDRSQ